MKCLAACQAVCRVAEFDPARLKANLKRCSEKLAPFSTRDAYLQMLEEIYNYGRSKLFALRIAAIEAMRERDPSRSKAEKAA